MITNTSLDANRWDQKIECVKNWFSLIYEEIIHSAIKLFFTTNHCFKYYYDNKLI